MHKKITEFLPDGIWDSSIQDYTPVPSPMVEFLQDILDVYTRHELSISHEDGHGSFIVEDFDACNVEWLCCASKSYNTSRNKVEPLELNKYVCTYHDLEYGMFVNVVYADTYEHARSKFGDYLFSIEKLQSITVYGIKIYPLDNLPEIT